MKPCNYTFECQIEISHSISSGASVDVEQYFLSARLTEQRVGLPIVLGKEQLRVSFPSLSQRLFLPSSLFSHKPLGKPTKPRRLN